MQLPGVVRKQGDSALRGCARSRGRTTLLRGKDTPELPLSSPEASASRSTRPLWQQGRDQNASTMFLQVYQVRNFREGRLTAACSLVSLRQLCFSFACCCSLHVAASSGWHLA